MIPLSKVMDLPRDYAQLVAARNTVLLYGGAELAAQAPERVWEYSMALEAYRVWQATHQSLAPFLLDVGGAGSPLARLLRVVERHAEIAVIDPNEPDSGETIEQYATHFARQADAVFAISVIEHVQDETAFLKACAALVRPGGLLCLTTDYWDGEGKDTAHFHWMRERIYNQKSWGACGVYLTCVKLGLRLLGDRDTTYHGPHLYGSYTFASLALQKEV